MEIQSNPYEKMGTILIISAGVRLSHLNSFYPSMGKVVLECWRNYAERHTCNECCLVFPEEMKTRKATQIRCGGFFTKQSMRWRGKTKCGSHKAKRSSSGLIYSMQLYCSAKAASDLNSQSLIWFLHIISRVKYFFSFLFQGREKKV